MIFDGATSVAEVLTIVVRFVIDWQVQQREIALRFYDGSFDGNNLATALFSILCEEFGIDPADVIAAVHASDMCAVNPKAMKRLRALGNFEFLFSLGCISHTIDNAGSKFAILIVTEWLKVFLALMAMSGQACDAFLDITGESYCGYSTTRWGSRLEVIGLLERTEPKLLKWVEYLLDNGVGPKAAPKLLSMINSPGRWHAWKIEARAASVVGKKMVESCYMAEGDHLDNRIDLVFTAFHNLNRLRTAFAGGASSILHADETMARLVADAQEWSQLPEASAMSKAAKERLKQCSETLGAATEALAASVRAGEAAKAIALNASGRARQPSKQHPGAANQNARQQSAAATRAEELSKKTGAAAKKAAGAQAGKDKAELGVVADQVAALPPTQAH